MPKVNSYTTNVVPPKGKYDTSVSQGELYKDADQIKIGVSAGPAYKVTRTLVVV